MDGKIVGIPALVDNLALVYNKKLFDQAHVAYPTANWTWDDITAAAKKLTNPANKQFGWAYVNDGGEDTVWRYDALLWEAGGQHPHPRRQARCVQLAGGRQGPHPSADDGP